MVTLSFDYAAAIDSRLEAVGVKVTQVNICYGLPVWKEEFHSRCSDAFYGLEVTHIGICFVLNKLVEEHAIDVFCTEGVHHLREILHVDGPALINHILGNSRQVPTFNEAMEAVQERGFSETVGQRVEVSVV